MAILRNNGEGGSGDATGNATITEIQNLRSEAQLASAEAQAAQEYSEEWANKAEDSLVSTDAGGDGVDDYSALHHRNKAADSATAAATSESNAATSEANAATSESNAATSETNAAASAAEAATYVADQTDNGGKFLQTDGTDVSWQSALVPSDIGVSVQAYDVNTAKYDDTTANFTGTLQNGGSNVVVDSDIGVNVQAYSVVLQNTTASFTTADETAIDNLDTDYVDQDSNTGAASLPTGTTAQRPVTPSEGMFRRNSETGSFEGYTGSEWAGVGGASGGAGNPFVYENDTNVTADYTITTGKNAMSAGPITIDTGFTVTVPSGSVWTIV